PTYIPRELVVPNVSGRSCPIQAVGKEHHLFRATWAFNMFSGGWNKKGQLGRAANRSPSGYTGLSTPDELIVDPAAWGYSNITAYIYAPYGEGYDPKYDNVTGGTSNITYFENNNCDARLAAGDYFSMAVKRTGGHDALYIWGDNSEGQLGLSVVNKDNIVRRPAPLFSNIESNDDIYKNSMSRYVSSTPVKDKITEIAAGRAHGLAVSESGTLYAWGANGKGQLTRAGAANAVNDKVKSIPAPAGTKWLNVWAGSDRTIALADDYNLYTWGDNKDGILGVGKSDDFIAEPVKLTFDIRPAN
ncbi:MAG: hypothetical protein K2N67_04905, partial [Mucispirillum sp.]|nr:hypothetical protein [Mucispirillum sp.]